jgi:hypothetical protein
MEILDVCKALMAHSGESKRASVLSPDRIFADLLNDYQRRELAQTYISETLRPGSAERRAVIEVISLSQPHSVRKAALETMAPSKFVNYFIDSLRDAIPEALGNIQMVFLLKRRLSMVISLFESLDLMSSKGPETLIRKIQRLSESAARKKVKDALIGKYPYPDIIFMLAVAGGQWPDLALFNSYIDAYVGANKVPKSPAPRRYGSTQEAHDIIVCWKKVFALQNKIFWHIQNAIPLVSKPEAEKLIPAKWVADDIYGIHEQAGEIKEMLLKYKDYLQDEDLHVLEDMHNVQGLKYMVLAVKGRIKHAAQFAEQSKLATLVLSRMGTLRHRDINGFEPLLKVQSEAAHIAKLIKKNRLDGIVETVVDLAASKHHYNGLCDLVAEEHLDLQRYDNLKQVVTHKFDSELALAALRGRLFFESEADRSAIPGNGKFHLPVESQSTVANFKSAVPAIEAVTKSAESEKGQLTQVSKEALKKKYAYCFPADMSAQAISHMIQSGTIKDETAALRNLVWRLLDERDLLNAFKSSLYLEVNADDDSHLVPGWLVALLPLSVAFKGPETDSARMIAIESCLSRWDSERVEAMTYSWQQGLEMLLAGGVALVALQCSAEGASSVNARNIIKTLRVKGSPKLNAMVALISGFVEKYIPLSKGYLESAAALSEWQCKHTAVVIQSREWFASLQNVNIKYKPALQALQAWIGKKGFLREFIDPVVSDEINRVDDVSDLIDYIGDDKAISQEIRNTSKKLGLAKADISGVSYDQLLKISRESAQVANAWVESVLSRPAVADEFVCQAVGDFVKEFAAHSSEALAEMKELSRNDSVITRAASGWVVSVISQAMELCGLKGSENKPPLCSPAELEQISHGTVPGPYDEVFLSSMLDAVGKVHVAEAASAGGNGNGSGRAQGA